MRRTTFPALPWQSLSGKLFLSYLLLIVVVALVVLQTINLVAPAGFADHMAMMARTPMQGMMTGQDTSVRDGTAALQASLQDATLSASGIALGVALVLSFLATRLTVAPLRRMAVTSHSLATGDYSVRVPVRGNDEIAMLATSFNTMAATLEATERRRVDLIGDVAHELRTPLATLAGYLEGLLDGVVVPSEDIWILLHEEAGRLRRLVDDLLELSRVESGNMVLHSVALAPARLVQDAIHLVESQFTDKGLQLTVACPVTVPPVQADRDRVIQVLTNLLGNALRYTPAPGRVMVGVTTDSTSVHFRVTDTGPGIAPEHLPHLFERFYRVDKSRSRALGGSGIGLTIAKALVEAMGGTITASSPGPGRGTTFTFSLPLAR